MQKVQMVACSTNITLHSLGGKQPIVSYKPHRGIVNSAHVNHSNRVIASSGQDGRIILVAAENPSSVMLEKYFSEEKEKPTSVNCSVFSPHSNFLAAGAGDGTVKIWDMKSTSNVHQHLKCHSATVTSLAWVRSKNNFGDIIASSSVAGDVSLHAARTGKPLDTYLSKNKEVINCLKVSQGEAYSRMGISTAVGSVQVWDLNAQQKASGLICDFNVSSQSIPCFSLSSFNPVLMVTAGLDEKLVFFDILLKKHVKTVAAQQPLNAVVFHPNGHSLMVGGLYGGLFVYDLRKLEKPKQKLVGHQTCIKYIDYFKDYDAKESSQRNTASRGSTSAMKTNDNVQSIVSQGSSQQSVASISSNNVLPTNQTIKTATVHATVSPEAIKPTFQDIPKESKQMPKSGEIPSRQVQAMKTMNKKSVEVKPPVENKVTNQNKLSMTGQEVVKQKNNNRDDLRTVHLSPPKEQKSEMLDVERRIKSQMYDCFQRFQVQMIRQFQLSQQQTKIMLEELFLREKKKDQKIKELENQIYTLKKMSY